MQRKKNSVQVYIKNALHKISYIVRPFLKGKNIMTIQAMERIKLVPKTATDSSYNSCCCLYNETCEAKSTRKKKMNKNTM